MKKLKPVVVALTLALGCVLGVTVPAYAADSGGLQPMHRLYNPNSGEHFYTASTAERNAVVKAGWRDEGIGWTAPAKSNVPVYRLYNPNAGDHHYTTNKAENDMLVRAGWRSEGIGWYSSETKAVAILRQYNPNAYNRPGGSGAHNYTASQAENNHLISVGWRAEGIGWYGIDTESMYIIGLFELAPDGENGENGWLTKSSWPGDYEGSNGNYFYVKKGEKAPIPQGYVPFTGTRTYTAPVYPTGTVVYTFVDGMLTEVDGVALNDKYHFDWRAVELKEYSDLGGIFWNMYLVKAS